MIENVIIGQYVARDSILHRLDPRTKLMAIAIFMLLVFFLHSYISYVLVTCLVLGCLACSKIPPSFFIKGLLPILFILSFTFVYHLFLTKGENLIFQFGYLHIYMEGIVEGCRVLLKIVLLVLMTSLLTLTTKPLDIAYGLETIMRPLKKLHVPVEQFALMLSIALRFIPTIIQELDRIMDAQRSRGVQFDHQSKVKRITNYIPVIIPLLLTSIQRAENLSLAIDARAYSDGRNRTRFKLLKFKSLDYWTLSILLLVLLGLLFLKVGGEVF